MKFLISKLFRLSLFIALLILTNNLHSQKTSHANTMQYSSTNGGSAYFWQSISDKKGNVYSTGYFYRTIDFDPGSGTTFLTSSISHDAFISKHNRAGKLVWAKQIRGTNTSHGYSIVLDDSSNVYTTGYFQGTTDFDPGTGTFNLLAKGNIGTRGGSDIYVHKLDSNGQFVWVKQMGGLGSDMAWTITRNKIGNLFIGGLFEFRADFDPSTSVFSLSSNGGRDAFICSLTSNGLLNWAKSFGGSKHDEVKSIKVSDSLVYSTGAFHDTVDFDTDTSKYIVNSLGSSDAFIHILNTSGSFIKVSTISGSSANWGNDISLDKFGNILVTGVFSSKSYFGDSSKQVALSSKGRMDSYVSKYTENGGLIWAKSLGGTMDVRGSSITSDIFNNVYTLGVFNGNVDFDPDTMSNHYVNTTSQNVYISRLDSNGKFRYVSPFVGSQSESFSVEITPTNEILTSGFFYGTTDFDPDTGKYNLVAKGRLDAFITLLSQCEFTDTNYSKIVCDSLRSPSNKFVWNKSGFYNDTLVNSSGCDSIITINLTVNKSARDTSISTSCNGFVSPSGKRWTSTGVYIDTIPTTKGCDSLLVINLTIKNSVLDTLYLNGCDSIRSPSGLHLWTATGVYQDTLTASNTCDSVLAVFVELGQTKLTNIQDTSCSEITSPSGKFVWSSTGVYYDTLATPTSCDSVLKYELFIPNVKVTIKDSSGFLVASTSFMTYQWFECKEQFKKINGENKHLYKYQRSGEFTVEAIEHSCADTSGCLEVTISNIFTPEKTSSLKLFPNPTRGKLTIDAENYKGVEVYDVSGRLIIKSKLKTIDLEEQSKGLYLLKVNANGTTQEFKVFKE